MTLKPYKKIKWPVYTKVVDVMPTHRFKIFKWKIQKALRRDASNYYLKIIIKRSVYENTPWVYEQEIWECRWWVTRTLLIFPAIFAALSKNFRANLEIRSHAVELHARAHWDHSLWGYTGGTTFNRSLFNLYVASEARGMKNHYSFYKDNDNWTSERIEAKLHKELDRILWQE